MVLTDKTQCRSCTEYGRVKELPGWCCIGVDDKGKVHCEQAARRSNCWCLDCKPNGKPFKMANFHIIGKLLTERYGVNVKLTPLTNSTERFSTKKVTDFRVEIESRKLRFPITAVFSLKNKDCYTFEEVIEILKRYEVQENDR